MFLKYSIYIFLLVCQAITEDTEEATLRIQNGAVRGRLAYTVGQGRPYFAFQGIPFAEPPVGNLRFSAPVPKSNWEGTWDATRERDICVQSVDPIEGSEDCLFVNVYTPELPTSLGNTPSLPVMVYLYGGGFTAGSSKKENQQPDFLLEKDVVIVIGNYRVGVFGFTSTEDSVVPGNAGLKDQLLTLQWVQKNIAAFGGDPGSVTLFGQSAGAASVAYHLQSPLSRGTFHRAVLQSGASLSTWALSTRAAQTVISLAGRFNFNSQNSTALIQYLRSVSYRDLQIQATELSNANLLASNPLNGFTYAPVIEIPHEGAIVTQRSHEQLRRGDFSRVPILIGYNSLEGAFTMGPAMTLMLLRYDLFPAELVPPSLVVPSDSVRRQLGLTIRTHYFGTRPVRQSHLEVMQFISHDQFLRPIRELVNLVKNYVDCYFYRFSYQGGLWGNDGSFPGATHSEELGYLWNTPHNGSEKDDQIREKMTTLWTNFARTGNPTPVRERVLQNLQWTPTNERLNFLEIDAETVMKENPEQEAMQFWDNIFDNYAVPPLTTF